MAILLMTPWVLFIIPGLIAAYVIFARPVLKARFVLVGESI
ncbi:hypothetical protein NB311A_20466 [Nitrobacter sp. Nb-311A]|nr:hypothetical protein [Nitrobacter sp. Nb-311A]EAQ36349.1 hypothetical protein NB311A_20466 [Nitrobacter sp. Nb-311A]